MKLKYKKIVLAVTMSTMCIGFVTISLTSPKVNPKKADSEKGIVTTQGAIDVNKNAEDESYNLECDAYPEINELVEKYLAATVTGNMDALEDVVSDIDNISEDMVNNKTQIIESHQNIQCYTIKVPSQDAFIVYVYSELKLVGIDTPAPGLTRLYICMTESGSYRIYLNQIDATVQSFIENSRESTQVQALVDKVNQLFENAVNSDAKLKAFYEQIEDTSNSEETEESTEEPTATDMQKETPDGTAATEPAATGDAAVSETPISTESADVMTTDLPAEETEAAYE